MGFHGNGRANWEHVPDWGRGVRSIANENGRPPRQQTGGAEPPSTGPSSAAPASPTVVSNRRGFTFERLLFPFRCLLGQADRCPNGENAAGWSLPPSKGGRGRPLG